jgi:hypothetical protein
MATGYVQGSGAAIALAAATPKTIFNLIAGANSQAIITEFSISFDGVTASAVPVLVELCQSTQAGAGSGQSTPTPAVIRGQGTSGSTFGLNYATTEPTALTVIKQWLVTPNGGLLVIQSPLGREVITNLSGSATVKAIALRCNAPAVVNCRGYMEWEE